MGENLQSMTNKHRAPSLLESRAKRERLDAAKYQNPSSVLLPQLGGFDTGAVQTINSLPDMRLTESDFSLFNNNSFSDSVYEISNFCFPNMAPQLPSIGWNGVITSNDLCYNELAVMNQGMNMAQHFASGNISQIYPQTTPHQLSLGNSKLADFLALRKTQGNEWIMLASIGHLAYSKSDFQNLARILQPTCDDSLYPPIDTITYNPEKEVLTLTAYSEMKVKKAMADLGHLIDKFSTREGRKNLMTSQSSTSCALLLDSPSARQITNPGTARVFPIKPKEKPRLVQIWFKSILPALPNILSERLNGRYSVSLVRRGQSDFTAEPCIQIESPCLPGQKAQAVIKDLVNKVWEKDGQESVPMRFIEGSIKKLGEVEGADDDDGAQSAYLHRLDLNFNRPYSKPGMGASLGLLCSDKVSATLGGYVLIGGEKYMLTVEHLVGKARQAADTDDDYVTITSPSREILKKIKNNLVQTEKDIDSQIKSLGSRFYGDRNIPDNDFSDPNNQSPELNDLMSQREVVFSLLNQVMRSRSEYAVGTVKSLSIEPRDGVISSSLANDLGLPNNELIMKHKMDWALIRTNSHTAHNGENRHKYRSNEDAIQDDLYVDEDGHTNQPREVVYETCSPRSAETVYYVGQRSKHRSGRVSAPILDGHSRTYAWGILGLDGHGIPEEDVKGDSGAWVIRKEDNKLMGQVHSHAQGQVLFTPIDMIFAELKEICESDVSLPPRPPGSDNIPSTSTTRQLCSPQQTPPARPYQFNNSPGTLIPSPKTSPIEITLPKAGSPKSLSSVTTSSNNNNTHSQISSDLSYDSSSSLPTLADYALSSVTTPEYPKSPPIIENADSKNRQVNIEKLPSKSPPTIVGESTTSDIPYLSLDEQGEDQSVESEPLTIQFNFQSLLGATSANRTSLWPVLLEKSQVAKAPRGSGFPRPRTFRRNAVPYSARAVIDRLARFARRIGTFSPRSLSRASEIPKANDAR